MTMTDDKDGLQVIFIRRVGRLNALFNGLVTGLLFGLGILLATNWLVLKGGPVVGPHLALLGEFFIGYRVTFAGSLVGFAYGFAAGFVAGFAVAWLYNRALELRARGRA